MYGVCVIRNIRLKTQQFSLTRKCQCSNIDQHPLENKNETKPIDGRNANNVYLQIPAQFGRPAPTATAICPRITDVSDLLFLFALLHIPLKVLTYPTHQ